MTPDLTADSPVEASNQVPSTAGMTTKVVKGSMWTLAGSVAPLAVSFISTPFIIRFLGTEGYGVLLLVGLIPTYFAFADLGMGIASTKFGASAYGEGDLGRERSVVKSAALLCLGFSTLLFSPIFLFADQIVPRFNVPPPLLEEAAFALRISTVAFVIALLSSVVNTPQLARIRMDLNSIASGAPKILMALLTPVILYFGGGIAEAVWLGLAAAVVSLGLNLYFSSSLLPGIWRASIDASLLRPLLKVGVGWFFASVATTLLANLEKLVLAKFVSVQALAYYSVAFTFAGMITLFSMALRQSLIPAFAQLSSPNKRQEFEALVRRGVRLTLVVMIPALAFLCVIARPFFTIWAGEDFGKESSLPFYILAFGLFFSVLSYLPHSAILAGGRTDILARLYWVELGAYAITASALIYWFGILGAAAAWTLRVIFDSLTIIVMARKVTGVSFGYAANGRLLVGSLLIMFPAAGAAAYNNFSPLLILLTPLCLAVYGFFVWNSFIDHAEKSWFRSKLAILIG